MATLKQQTATNELKSSNFRGLKCFFLSKQKELVKLVETQQMYLWATLKKGWQTVMYLQESDFEQLDAD